MTTQLYQLFTSIEGISESISDLDAYPYNSYLFIRTSILDNQNLIANKSF